MVDQQQQDGVAVRHSLVVDAPQDRAFTVFTQRMRSWWPMESHRIGGKPITDLVTEPRAGGRWYELAEDGSECDWGHVVAWEPPDRVVLTWEISHEWKPAPEIRTEVEVRFTPEGENRTRVDLEHRGLEAFGEHTEQMRGIFGSDGGWGGLLRSFATASAAAAD
jgi:uncharacterized protein YndB with AHSA1/START domain